MKKVILNDKYELGGGMGSWAKSYESATVTVGDVRLIGGVLMSAYMVRSPSFFSLKADEVHWTPVDDKYNNFDNLRIWINQVNE